MIGCGREEAPEEVIPLSEREKAHLRGTRHASLRVTAADALKPLLDTRAALGVSRFDQPIRDLTLVLCDGVSEDDVSRIQNATVDEIFPLDRWTLCKAVKCGGCFTYDGTYLHGAAFLAMPRSRPTGESGSTP